MLGLNVCVWRYISISPYHGSLDDIRNKVSSMIDALDVESLDDDGKSQSNAAKTRDFFDLDFINSRSNSRKMAIHFKYLPPSN